MIKLINTVKDLNKYWDKISIDILYTIWPDPSIDEQLANRYKKKQSIDAQWILSHNLIKINKDNLEEINSFLKHKNIPEISSNLINNINDMIKKDDNIKNVISEELQALLPEIIKRTKDDTNAVQDANELAKLNDNINDTTNVSNEFSVDIGAREYPFIYINGKIKKGTAGTIHQMLIDEYLKEHDIDIKMNRNTENIQDNNLAFGHVSNNMAFIDTNINCNYDDIVSALANEGFKKVYKYNYTEKEVTRLAKRL